MNHGMSKHKKLFLKGQVGKERLKIEYCKIELQLTDILLKSLKQVRFESLKGLVRTRNLRNLN